MVIILDILIRLRPGKDATQKLIQTMTAFYSKLSDRKQLSNIQKMIDDAWNDGSTIQLMLQLQTAQRKSNNCI